MNFKDYGWERNPIRETTLVNLFPLLTHYTADESPRPTTLYPSWRTNRNSSAERRYVVLMPKLW